MIPAYNAELYILKALQSCSNQTYKDIEIIFCDDGSTDRTLEIAKEYSKIEPRLRIFTHSKNLGEAAARNTCLANSNGEYVARLDADDTDSSDRIEHAVALLHKNYDCVCCAGFFNREGKLFPMDSGKMIPEKYMRGESPGWPINGSIVASKALYDQIGFFDTSLKVGTDSDWTARACVLGARWAYDPQSEYFYRRHAQQLVKTLSHEGHSKLTEDRKRKYLEQWQHPYNRWRTIGIFPTGYCNLECQYCCQEHTKPNYSHMTKDTFENILKQIDDLHIDCQWIEYCGGEPTAWPHLKYALRLVKSRGIKQRVFSNAYDYGLLDTALKEGLIQDLILCSQTVPEYITHDLKSKYPDQVIVSHTIFKPLPKYAFANATPALCNCDRIYIMPDGTLNPCGNFYEHTARIFPDQERSFPLIGDWFGALRSFPHLTQDICSYCLGNRLVWNQMP